MEFFLTPQPYFIIAIGVALFVLLRKSNASVKLSTSGLEITTSTITKDGKVYISEDNIDNIITLVEVEYSKHKEDLNNVFKRTIGHAETKVDGILSKLHIIFLEDQESACHDDLSARYTITTIFFLKEELMAFVRDSLRINGFYDYIKSFDGKKVFTEGWWNYVNEKSDEIASKIRHYLKGQLGFIFNHKKIDELMDASGMTIAYFKDIIENIFITAWNHKQVEMDYKEKFKNIRNKLLAELKKSFGGKGNDTTERS